jgi:uncharacterized protein YcbX
MRVVSIYIYPLKSGVGVAVDEAVAEERGFRGDRRLMVVDTTGTFLSQRKHPRLGYVRVERCEDEIALHAAGREPVTVGAGGVPLDVTVWGDTVRAIDRGPDASRWLSELLGVEARLVEMPGAARRLVEDDDVAVSFADGYPYLLTSTASLADLNARIDGPPVPMRAFRPNIIIGGSAAWAEDDWSEIQIGNAEFEVAKPCTRCKIPTLDPDDPERRRLDGEPLRTLATFRRRADGGGVLFGENLICRTPGKTIRAGDEVSVLR